MNTSSKGTHRTTDRILDIFERVADAPGELSLSDLSICLDIPKSTLSPILHTMTDRGFLSLDGFQKYSIGISSYQIGNSFLQNFSVMTEIEKVMTSITEISMEASHFAVLSGGDVVYLKKIDSPQPIRMVSSVGGRLPAYSTSLGKALLIGLTKQELMALYPDGLTPLTPSTITDLDVLYSQIQYAQQTGYAFEIEESNEYIRCIAIPVRKGGRVVAALSISTPVFRYNSDKEALIKLLLKDAQKKIESIIAPINFNISSSM